MDILTKKNLRKVNRIVSVFVTITTIVWLSGVAMVMPAKAAITDGSLIRATGDYKVYIVNGIYKRWIQSADIFKFYPHLGFSVVQDVSPAVRDSYTDSWMVRADGDTRVYEINGDGSKHWLNMTAEEYALTGHKWAMVYIINTAERDWYSTGAEVHYTGSVTPTPTVTPGNVTVSLAADTPASGTLISGTATAQSGADLAHFLFNGNGTVTKVTLKRIGVSADATLSNIYLFDGATRLTDAASVSADSVINFSSSAGLFTVSGLKTISVKSDLAVNHAGETVGVQLTGVELSSGTATGTPISGNIHSIANATLATAAVAAPTPLLASTIDPANGVTVWQSTVTISNRNVAFTRLALKQINSIDSKDVTNFRLLIDGVEVATVANLDSNKYVTFVPSAEKTLLTGGRIFKVLADVIGGSSRKLQMSLRNKADIDLKDTSYGVNVGATGTFPASTGEISIASGSMTVQKTTASPSGNVTNAATDAVLAEYTLTAFGEAIKVETLKAGFAHVTSGDVAETSTLRNGRIMVDGAQVGSTTTIEQAGTSFTTNFIVSPGTPVKVQIRADIYDNDSTNAMSSGDKITATLMAPASANATLQVSSGTTSVPAADKAGNQLTVQVGTLSLAKQSTYANQNVVLPKTAYKLAAYNLTGNSTEDVTLDTITVDFTGAGASETFTVADLSDVYVKYGTNTTTTKASVSATALANTWSISYTLAKNTTIPVEVYATLGSTVTNDDTMQASLLVSGTTVSSTTAATTNGGAVLAGQLITAKSGVITGAKDAASAVTANIDDNQTVSAAAFKITTTNDSATITEVTISAATSTTIQSVRLKDGSTQIGSDQYPNADNDVTFAGISVPVIANSSKVLTVEYVLGTVGFGSGTAGEEVTATLTTFKSLNSSGVSSTTTSNAAANALYVYKSIPTITNLNLPSTVLSSGTLTLAKFSISTGGTGTIDWNKIKFNISKSAAGATDPNITSFTFVNADTGSTIAGSFDVTSCAATTAACDTTFTATASQEVVGTTNYALKAAVTVTATTGMFISTNIETGAAAHAAPVAIGSVAAGATFVWSDESAQTHSLSSTDWNDDWLVKNLTTDSQTLTK